MKTLLAVVAAVVVVCGTATASRAQGCLDYRAGCKKAYTGPDPAACEKAYAACLKTCKFVGPGTGRVFDAVGTGVCSPANRAKRGL